jgi:hypothetical protein
MVSLRYAPAALPPGKTRYPLYKRLGGIQGRSRRVRNISPPPGFDPRTVHPVASRYTDWDISAHLYMTAFCNMYLIDNTTEMDRIQTLFGSPCLTV